MWELVRNTNSWAPPPDLLNRRLGAAGTQQSVVLQALQGLLILVQCEAAALVLCASQSRCAGLSHQLCTPVLERGRCARFTEEDTEAWEGSALPKAQQHPNIRARMWNSHPRTNAQLEFPDYQPRTLSSPPLLLVFNPFLPFLGDFLSSKYIAPLLFNQSQISKKIHLQLN